MNTFFPLFDWWTFLENVQIYRRNSNFCLEIVFSGKALIQEGVKTPQIWHGFRKKNIKSEDRPEKTMAMFSMRIPHLYCSLASHDASPEAHHHRKRRGLMYSVLDRFSMWSSVLILELCLQFLCYQTFPLCSSFVPLISFVLTFVTNTEHFLAWLFSVSLYFQYFWGKGIKLTSILMVFSQFVAGKYLLYKQSYWSKLARWNIIYSNKWVLILNINCI